MDWTRDDHYRLFLVNCELKWLLDISKKVFKVPAEATWDEQEYECSF